jgi:hypothetical protein
MPRARRSRRPVASCGRARGAWRGGVPAATLAVCLSVAACGKKGPPLAPFVRIPAAIEKIETRRVGNDAYVTLVVPNANLDQSVPVDIGRVEVYAFTSLTLPPRARFLEGARLVGTFPVVPPPVTGTAAAAAPVAVAPPPPGGALPGGSVTVRDALGTDDLVPHELPPPPGRREALVARATAVLAPPATELRRFYVAIPFSSRGVAGPPSNIVSLPLTQLPERPLAPRVSYLVDKVALEWEPAGGFLGFVLDRALPPEPAPSDRFDPAALRAPALVPGNLPAGPTGYNVYRESTPDPLVLPSHHVTPPEWAATLTAPVNTTPLTAPSFTEVAAFDGRQVCYTVSAVRGAAPNAVEGPRSERVCVIPVDIFPPAAPRGLSAIAGQGVIDLVWEPNTDPDLGGYLVLRGEAGDATLAQLVAHPIAETRYSDRTVVEGRRYVYAVVAADARLPLPNVSAESVRVEEVAR